MTVMPLSADVADKAVSTEDGEASSGLEVARLHAVISALVEGKLEAMRADSMHQGRRAASEPVSPRPRLTSSSTLSSAQQRHHHSHHSQHHHHHQQQQQQSSLQQQQRKSHKRHRRHGSAPCHADLAHHGRSKRSHRSSDDGQPIFDPRRFEMLGVEADHGLSLIAAVDRARAPHPPISSDAREYPSLYQSACCVPHSHAHQQKSQYEDEDDDYLAFGYADELCGGDEETSSLPTSLAELGLGESHYRQRQLGSFHRPRRKRRRRKKRQRDKQRRVPPHLVDIEADELELGVVYHDDLPPRARWTIMATACILLAMSLLLVGVTLRMAPIIDEMGDGRRASACSKRKSLSGSRRASVQVPGGGGAGGRRASCVGQSHRRDSTVRRASALLATTSSSLEALKDPQELARARRHRLVAIILLATFAFILLAAVLAVVITLTHSSFHAPPIGSKELAEHRANSARRTKSY